MLRERERFFVCWWLSCQHTTRLHFLKNMVMVTPDPSIFDNFVWRLLRREIKSYHMLMAQLLTYDSYQTCHMLMVELSTILYFLYFEIIIIWNKNISYVNGSEVNISILFCMWMAQPSTYNILFWLIEMLNVK